MFYVFDNADDAIAVEMQLYNVCRFENIIYGDLDHRAVLFAAQLAGVKYSNDNENIDYVNGFCCRLKFPGNPKPVDKDSPQIYVRCLAAYNAGYLHGMWVDCAQDLDEVWEDINYMLSWSPMRNKESCEEWAIHDSCGWHGISVREHGSIEKLVNLAQIIKEHGKGYAAYCRHYGTEYATVEDFEELFVGVYKSEKDFAEDMYTETGITAAVEKAGLSQFYINWELLANDMFINNYLAVEIDDGIAVFRKV